MSCPMCDFPQEYDSGAHLRVIHEAVGNATLRSHLRVLHEAAGNATLTVGKMDERIRALEAERDALKAENEILFLEREGHRELSHSFKARAEKAEARVAELEEVNRGLALTNGELNVLLFKAPGGREKEAAR